MAHPWDLSDEQFEAVRALQRGGSPPTIERGVWLGLLRMGMISIDESVEPPLVRLTAIGRNYDAT